MDRKAELVYLAGEDFPRLRSNGRLLWLGPHGAGVNYHDPGADGELVVTLTDSGDEDPEWVTDPDRWCPPPPAGIRGVVAVPDEWRG